MRLQSAEIVNVDRSRAPALLDQVMLDRRGTRPARTIAPLWGHEPLPKMLSKLKVTSIMEKKNIVEC